MRIKYSITIFIFMFLVGCTPNTQTNNVPAQTNVSVTESTIPLNSEAQNLIAFEEMGIRIGFNYPENFEQGASTNVVGVYEPNAAFELAYPQHARILFTAYSGDAETILATGIRVFKVEDIDALEAGIIGELEAVLAGQSDHRIDFPRLAGAGSMIDSQFKLLAFQNGNGYRFLNLKSFDASSLRGTGMMFLYQGVTSDGKYFVSFVTQVNAPFLQEFVDQPLTTQEDFENYFRTINQRIETTDINLFEPSLAMLDELISSIVIVEK